MPRQKVEVKPIENRQAMQVTFSKRRKGLFKKVKELAVMCKAMVAVIVFSAANKLTQFGDPSVDEVIERRYKDQGRENPQLHLNITQEHQRLSRKYIEEEFIVSQMAGLKLENLQREDLNQLEVRMENTLRLVREKKERACYEDGHGARQNNQQINAAQDQPGSSNERQERIVGVEHQQVVQVQQQRQESSLSSQQQQQQQQSQPQLQPQQRHQHVVQVQQQRQEPPLSLQQQQSQSQSQPQPRRRQRQRQQQIQEQEQVVRAQRVQASARNAVPATTNNNEMELNCTSLRLGRN